MMEKLTRLETITLICISHRKNADSCFICKIFGDTGRTMLDRLRSYGLIDCGYHTSAYTDIPTGKDWHLTENGRIYLKNFSLDCFFSVTSYVLGILSTVAAYAILGSNR